MTKMPEILTRLREIRDPEFGVDNPISRGPVQQKLWISCVMKGDSLGVCRHNMLCLR